MSSYKRGKGVGADQVPSSDVSFSNGNPILKLNKHNLRLLDDITKKQNDEKKKQT